MTGRVRQYTVSWSTESAHGHVRPGAGADAVLVVVHVAAIGTAFLMSSSSASMLASALRTGVTTGVSARVGMADAVVAVCRTADHCSAFKVVRLAWTATAEQRSIVLGLSAAQRLADAIDAVLMPASVRAITARQAQPGWAPEAAWWALAAIKAALGLWDGLFGWPGRVLRQLGQEEFLDCFSYMRPAAETAHLPRALQLLSRWARPATARRTGQCHQ